MVKGECNCGTVSYEASGELFGVVICHCSICRRLTGSAGIAVVLVSNDGFAWTGGEGSINTWSKPGHDWQTWFCSICSSPVPGPNDEERMFIPAGSLTEGHQTLEVTHHIWVDSKANWDLIGDAGQQHPNAFEE